MGLDGVELILAAEEEFGITISDGDAERVMTPRDLIEAVCSKLDMDEGELDPDFNNEEFRKTCSPSKRAFYKVRSAIMDTTGVERGEVKLETDVEELFPKFRGKTLWNKFLEKLGLEGWLPWYGSWFRGHHAPRLVQDVVDSLVAKNPPWLCGYGRWCRSLVRERVRAMISAQLDVRDFDDDDDLVRDLGLS